MSEQIRCEQCDADASNDSIAMHSGVNHKHQGFVHLAWGKDLRIQFTPDDLRQHALRLLEAAEAAESDAMVLRLLTEKIGLDRSKSLAVIADLRNFRDERYEVKK